MSQNELGIKKTILETIIWILCFSILKFPRHLFDGFTLISKIKMRKGENYIPNKKDIFILQSWIKFPIKEKNREIYPVNYLFFISSLYYQKSIKKTLRFLEKAVWTATKFSLNFNQKNFNHFIDKWKVERQ